MPSRHASMYCFVHEFPHPALHVLVRVLSLVYDGCICDVFAMCAARHLSSYARMKGKKRSDLALEAFRNQETGPRALILPIKSGSHGLNLVRFSYRVTHVCTSNSW